MTHLFSANSLDLMRGSKQGFDPQGRFNPGKVLPSAKGDEAKSTNADNGPDAGVGRRTHAIERHTGTGRAHTGRATCGGDRRGGVDALPGLDMSQSADGNNDAERQRG